MKNITDSSLTKTDAVDSSYSNVSFTYILSKRILDILMSLIAFILLSPLMIIITLFYITGENKGTPFFRQKRYGKNGKMFNIYKFRTMVLNAEEKIKENDELYNLYVRNSYKLEQEIDPRITKFGRFLRKTSLDELPQLLNVIRGDMSLVGPRPIVEDELKEYGSSKDEFLSVKPGLTGYWQVSGRSEVNYPERVDLELFYVKNQSFQFDLKILIQTIYSVIKRKGAY
jgi:exopolysaccharide production protein ExoY